MADIKKFVSGILRGDTRSIAKLISLVENNASQMQKILSLLTPYVGKAHIIGVTGPPGGGKSTLIAKLAKKIRSKGKKLGIIAIDPTSPFSGGSLMGDRIRMQELCGDPRIFIRSMATRGALGGVTKQVQNVIKIFDASGKDVIIVETVGTGQNEVAIKRIAHTTIVVLTPELGDYVQTLKAGIMEIGDIFVVNKADKSNAGKTVREIEEMVDAHIKNGWEPPVLKVIAITSYGIDLLADKIEDHKKYIKTNPEMWIRIVEEEFINALECRISEYILRKLKDTSLFKETIMKIENKEIDPYTAAENILALLLRKNIKCLKEK